MSNRPIIFLDFDDVIVLNRPGPYDYYFDGAPISNPETRSRLFDPQATQVLVEVLVERGARVVITTGWLRLLAREGFERLFAMSGLEVLQEKLHEVWEAPQDRGETRAQAIDRWLAEHHRGEPYVVLDDEQSGTGLRNSGHQKRRRLVLCKEGIGLQQAHLAIIRGALSRKARR